ncbi:hypothetical protein VE03_10587, partial [Pseudogymnoascus sp. 23342-1-I1]
MSTSASITSGIFEEISTGFEEPDSFIQFLTALLTPPEPSIGLNDDLPFPENLGSSKRMPGIDTYIHFVLGQIFVRKSRTAEIISQPQQRLLSLMYLDFISTWLNTFNEDLVVFANQSNVSVDSAIKASDLDTSLISEFESNIDMEEASESLAYNIKLHILDFVNACLQAMPNRPSIAHLLLGFRCESESLEVLPEPVQIEPVQIEQNIIAPWLTRLKSKALQVIRTLWRSPISSQVVMVELRSHSFFTHLWTSEVIISPQTISGLGLPNETYFGLIESQNDINDFLSQRSMLFQYVALELRRVSKNGSTSVRQQISNTLLGRTTIEDGTEIQNYTIFDMFDFMVVDPAAETFPISPYFKDLNFNVCLTGNPGEPHVYDIKRVEALSQSLSIFHF